MISVAVGSEDLTVVQEFFELFKTPWEPAVPGRRYAVVLSTDGAIRGLEADLFLVYGSTENALDREYGVAVEAGHADDLHWGPLNLAIYGRVATFETPADSLRCGERAAAYVRNTAAGKVQRVGYDLFGEVRHLLTTGQPPSKALTPALELHIDFLRQLLVTSGVSFVEIPPRPDHYDFICCLTHDVDFFGIRRHKFDRTLAGFVLRASLGTLVDLVRRRRSFREAGQNWMALLALPFVLAGLRADFWNPFADYLGIESGRKSTFFLIPFKDKPGIAPNGSVEKTRAVRYQASEIEEDAKRVARGGSELAVHGIDSWRDANAGRAEMSQLTVLTGRRTAGVRMHWLYFSEDAPKQLEAAGFDYDSTCGYNDAVGYRAGTSQVFRWPGRQKLMELPLSIMDSALFYSSRMGLSEQQATDVCRRIVSNARQYGGTLVINWHDRSVAPERLWGRFYSDLLDEVGEGDRAWFATAGEAVDWFRWRRSICFSETATGSVRIAGPAASHSRAAVVRVRRPGCGGEIQTDEHRFDGREPLTIDLGNVVLAREA